MSARRKRLIADDPTVYFTTPHFEGYPAILVRLERISEDDLIELLTEAWLCKAPKRLAPRNTWPSSKLRGR